MWGTTKRPHTMADIVAYLQETGCEPAQATLKGCPVYRGESSWSVPMFNGREWQALTAFTLDDLFQAFQEGHKGN